jgi:hypothetical protein
MPRRLPSVLARCTPSWRAALATVAALGLALACLNPQNDDLPSQRGSGPTATSNPNGNFDSPDTPAQQPATPQEPVPAAPSGGQDDGDSLAPPSNNSGGAEATPSDEPEPADAGTDAG